MGTNRLPDTTNAHCNNGDWCCYRCCRHASLGPGKPKVICARGHKSHKIPMCVGGWVGTGRGVIGDLRDVYETKDKSSNGGMGERTKIQLQEVALSLSINVKPRYCAPNSTD